MRFAAVGKLLELTGTRLDVTNQWFRTFLKVMFPIGKGCKLWPIDV